MVSLKQGLKQILIHRQHKQYGKELASKNLTYDEWIRRQERELNIATIKVKNEKKLTNDFAFADYEGKANENESKHAENGNIIHILEVFDESSQFFSGTMTLLCAPVFMFAEDAEFFLEKHRTDIVILSVYEGEMSKLSVPLVCQEFGKNKNTLVIYGDEDTITGDGQTERLIRENPWFKPDWSPDRFLSSFYFGGLVAVRTQALRKALHNDMTKADTQVTNTDKAAWLYGLLAEILKEAGAFEKGHDYQKLPVCHIRQILFHNRRDGYEQIKHLALLQNGCPGEKEHALLSVIIPSKDNTEALFQCLDSLLERTRTSYPLEIILVDNGSGEENKEKILRKIQEIKAQNGYFEQSFLLKDCKYIYEKMPFNFSRMCNIGAEKAKGELLLFLNDDMEIIQSDWLDKMADKALLPYAGAVGAKLLYPHSDTIQHAGITNLRVGPAHKLQFLSDEKVHYFGMNRGVHNMLGVTGACLMVRKDVFRQAGGFCEKLAVAFNDVDLCYTIFENGFYNIERNDVTLYHHESLSRGNDGDSPEKQLRLLAEKDMLYERHQPIYGRDPFYHPFLTTDMLEQEYSPAYRYQVTLDMPWSPAVPDSGEVKKAREDKCLVVGMECAMDIYKWKYGVSAEYAEGASVNEDNMGYYFQGYSFIIGADNACYKKKLLLKSKEEDVVWQIPVDARYRQDIKNNLHDQINVDLTGFAAKLKKNAVPAGIYQFGMLAEDKCSRQKLVNWSNWVLEVRADGKSFE